MNNCDKCNKVEPTCWYRTQHLCSPCYYKLFYEDKAVRCAERQARLKRTRRR